MAKLETVMSCNFEPLVARIENGILDGSISASLEDKSDFIGKTSRCSVRVFERFSYTGSNRVSMNITFFQENGGPIYISAITSGGSQGIFNKINTFGENAFLDKLKEIL